jgi:hypothetical protein
MGLHADERAELYTALLSAAPDIGLCLVAPDLHVVNPATRRFEPAPPASLALRSGKCGCTWTGVRSLGDAKEAKHLGFPPYLDPSARRSLDIQSDGFLCC